MRTKLLLIAIISGLMLASCGKKSVDPSDQVKLCTKITRFIQRTQFTAVTTITYDERNRISTITQGSAVQKFTYNNNDDLVKMVETDGKGAQTLMYEISYANGYPTGLKATNVTGTESYVYTVVDGRIVKATSSRLNIHYTYINNNLATSKLTATGAPIYYTYTTDKNPFYNARHKYQFMPVSAGFFREDTFSEGLEVEKLYSYDPKLGVWSSYNMSNDGFPKSAVLKGTVLGDPDTFAFTDVTYEYIMRDKVK